MGWFKKSISLAKFFKKESEFAEVTFSISPWDGHLLTECPFGFKSKKDKYKTIYVNSKECHKCQFFVKKVKTEDNYAGKILCRKMLLKNLERLEEGTLKV